MYILVMNAEPENDFDAIFLDDIASIRPAFVPGPRHLTAIYLKSIPSEIVLVDHSFPDVLKLVDLASDNTHPYAGCNYDGEDIESCVACNWEEFDDCDKANIYNKCEKLSTVRTYLQNKRTTP